MDQFVISLNHLSDGRKMIMANDTGQFLTTDGWNYLGTAFAIEADSLADAQKQLAKLLQAFWESIYGKSPDPYYAGFNPAPQEPYHDNTTGLLDQDPVIGTIGNK